MSDDKLRQGEAAAGESRRPRVFRLDDPGLSVTEPRPPDGDAAREPSASGSGGIGPGAIGPGRVGVAGGRARPLRDAGVRWGALLAAALGAAAGLALSLWFYRLVAVGLWRDDWAGWTMRGLLGAAAVAGMMILLREVIGFSRLGRLNRLQADLAAALTARDLKAERAAVQRLAALYRPRPELRWALSRLDEHAADVLDPGAWAALADREVMAPIDDAARGAITASAKRVATVTALSPIATIAVGFVLVENLRMLRRIAALYGGRPGFLGLVALTRSVLAHLVASGGVALTDDLIGQFIGQDLLRRLSRRLGEGAFNGALTARVGVAAIDIIRPLPLLAARPVRVRDILAEVLRRPAAAGGEAARPARSRGADGR